MEFIFNLLGDQEGRSPVFEFTDRDVDRISSLLMEGSDVGENTQGTSLHNIKNCRLH